MSETKIVLQFPTIHLLWRFAQSINSAIIEINTFNRTLSCDCGEVDVDKAKETYQARVL